MPVETKRRRAVGSLKRSTPRAFPPVSEDAVDMRFCLPASEAEPATDQPALGRGVGVGVGKVDAWLAASAAVRLALIRPPPIALPVAATRSAPSTTSPRSAAPDAFGGIDAVSAATPATCAAAIDEPESVPYPPPGRVEMTSTPGAP